MSAWKPIETAPEMEHVLLWYPDASHVIALVGTKHVYHAIGYLGDDTPTHWMPLPAPPVTP